MIKNNSCAIIRKRNMWQAIDDWMPENVARLVFLPVTFAHALRHIYGAQGLDQGYADLIAGLAVAIRELIWVAQR